MKKTEGELFFKDSHSRAGFNFLAFSGLVWSLLSISAVLPLLLLAISGGLHAKRFPLNLVSDAVPELGLGLLIFRCSLFL